VCDLETSRIGAPYIYIYDISSLSVNLTLNLVLFVYTSECNLVFLYIFIPKLSCLMNDKQKTKMSDCKFQCRIFRADKSPRV